MDFKQKFVRCYSNVKTHEQSHREEEDPPLKPLPSYQIPSPLLRPDSMDRMFGPPTSAGSKAFPDYDEPPQKQILDPASKLFLQWNLVFLFSCLVSLFVDPMYFLLPKVGVLAGQSLCLETDLRLKVIITCIRTITDMFYLLHIVIKFRTAYVAPSSLVFGKGELVMDPKKIASRYIRSDFFVDLLAMLPLPQIAIWLIIPAIRTTHEEQNNSDLALIVLIQYFARLYIIFPLSSQIVRTAGVVTKTAWSGAAYHLLLYLIASHLLGSLWYLFSIQRQTTCWEAYCTLETSFNNGTICSFDYFHCYTFNEPDRQVWANSTIVFSSCDPNNSNSTYNYGIYANAMVQGVLAGNLLEKYFYILWWGLQNLSSYDQPLIPSKFIGETTFALVITISGLVLFALLIGNMETYLHSITMRVEAWRLKRRDTEEWMKHRQLPPHLRDRVGQFLHYKWIVTQGVDEEAILQSLPPVLRRDIQRHLCLDLVRRVKMGALTLAADLTTDRCRPPQQLRTNRASVFVSHLCLSVHVIHKQVPLFAQMDDLLLDAICERLVSSLNTEGTCVVREGDPLTEMLFIIRGRLESSTTNGGQPGFFNSITLQPGDFCGEELLAWALLQRSTHNLPCSTRTVRALVEVEAFALRAEDIKFVANQFRRLHSKKLQHTFRYYSHHWRTWAACFIQTAWRQHRRRKMAKDLKQRESFSSVTDDNVDNEKAQKKDGNDRNGASASSIPLQAQQNLGVTIVTSWLAAKRRGSQKPREPDFSADPDDFYWRG